MKKIIIADGKRELRFYCGERIYAGKNIGKTASGNDLIELEDGVKIESSFHGVFFDNDGEKYYLVELVELSEDGRLVDVILVLGYVYC